MPLRLAIAIVMLLLCALAGSAAGQSDSARGTSSEHHGPALRVWGTFGMGSAHFDKNVESWFPPSLAEGWLAVGPVGVALRRVDAGAGINTTERIDKAWLLGARTTVGPVLLIAGAGRAEVSGRNSNGEQSGNTSPIDSRQAWTAEGELSLTLGHYVALGVSAFRTGGSRTLSSGKFVVVQVGRLR